MIQEAKPTGLSLAGVAQRLWFGRLNHIKGTFCKKPSLDLLAERLLSRRHRAPVFTTIGIAHIRYMNGLGSALKVMKGGKSRSRGTIEATKLQITMENKISCYYCGSTKVVRNGITYYGKPRKCKSCYKQFVLEGKNKSLRQEENKRIELWLLERVEGISRVVPVSAYQVYQYREELYGEIPEDLHAQVAFETQIDVQVLACESDELWSFVQKKVNKQWVALILRR